MTQADSTTLEVRGEREIIITRKFDAPARIVFEAWTRADLVKRWWAPKSHGVALSECSADVRPGGSYRYVLKRGTGEEMAFSGEYREVIPPSRLVYTQVFEPAGKEAPVLVTITFEERDGRTYVVSHELFPSRQVRDQVIASGMEHGLRETMQQLDQLLRSLPQT